MTHANLGKPRGTSSIRIPPPRSIVKRFINQILAENPGLAESALASSPQISHVHLRWECWRRILAHNPEYSAKGLADVWGVHHATVLNGLNRLAAGLDNHTEPEYELPTQITNKELEERAAAEQTFANTYLAVANKKRVSRHGTARKSAKRFFALATIHGQKALALYELLALRQQPLRHVAEGNADLLRKR